jgi:hypothetical protein
MASCFGSSPGLRAGLAAPFVALSLASVARAAPPPGPAAPPPEGSSWSTPPAPSASAPAAAPAAPAAAPAAPAAAPAGEAVGAREAAPVVVVVRAEGGELDAGRVRAEVARELGVPAVGPEGAPARTRGTLAVTWRAAARELVVGFQHPARGALTRVVDAPDEVERVPHAAALLAGNLARDEAGELPPAAGPAASGAPATAAPAPAKVPGHLSLFHPVATNRDAPDATVNASFNIIYGRVGGLDGVQLGGINAVAGGARGAQLALGWNWVRGPMSGLQASTFGFNVVRGSADAWQLAAGLNYVGGTIEGVQLGLGANVAGESVRGGQGAFVFNYAGGEVRGAQLAAINVAGDVRGLQAGLINVGGKVKGAQIGLINVADDVEGVPLGLVSVTKSGGVHPTVWASTSTFGNAGVKFATRYTYTMASAAYHESAGRALAGGGVTLGAQVPFDRTVFSFDVQYLLLFDTGPCSDKAGVPCGGADRGRYRHAGKARLAAGYRLQPHLGVFVGAGPALEVRRPYARAEAGPYGARFDERDVRVRVRPEFFGGLEF